MKDTIEIIKDNNGGVTIQDTETKSAIHFGDEKQAIEDVKLLISGEESDIESWEGQDGANYITNEAYFEHSQYGGYELIEASDFVCQ